MNRARWHRYIDALGHLDHGATIRAIAAAGTWSFGAIVGGFSESTVVAARRETLRAGCGLSSMLAELGGVFRGWAMLEMNHSQRCRVSAQQQFRTQQSVGRTYRPAAAG